MISPRAIIRKVLQELGTREAGIVRGMIPSRQLRAALELIIEENEHRAVLFIPHYWAVFYHDGRDTVRPQSAQKLVFFDNKNDDPRLRGGRYPETLSQVRRLTRREYARGLRINRERRRRGQRAFMFVVDSVGPSGAHPFFDELAQGAVARADALVRRAFNREIRRAIGRDKDTKSETGTATFRLR